MGGRISANKSGNWIGCTRIGGYPGRLCDLIKREAVKIERVRAVVLDEADEMLNMGFKEDLNFILDETPAERNTYLFSATMPS